MGRRSGFPFLPRTLALCWWGMQRHIEPTTVHGFGFRVFAHGVVGRE